MTDQPALWDTDTTELQKRNEELHAELKAAYAEQSRLNSLYMHYSAEHERRTEEARAAARKESWRSVTAAPRHHLLSHAAEPIKALADAVNTHRCEADREPLLAALRDVHASVEGREPQLDSAPLAEIHWLREYIRRAGARLHDEHAQADVPPYDRCRCPGCDLIHGTDLRGDWAPDQTETDRRTELEQRVIDAENARDDALQRLRFEQSVNEQLRKAMNHQP